MQPRLHQGLPDKDDRPSMFLRSVHLALRALTIHFFYMPSNQTTRDIFEDIDDIGGIETTELSR